MKLPICRDTESLCDQCVALCCRYYAFAIDEPENRRDFEYIRWYLLHEDCIVFVEEGDWYIQVNRKCKALMPDNRCAIYENRPTICREYTTKACDWHGDEYEYDHLFTEPDQVRKFADEYLAAKRKRQAARNARGRNGRNGAGNGSATEKAQDRSRPRRRPGVPLRLLRTA